MALNYSPDQTDTESLKKEAEAPPSPSEIRRAEEKPVDAGKPIDGRSSEGEAAKSDRQAAKSEGETARSDRQAAETVTRSGSRESPADTDRPIKPSFDVVRVNPRGDTVIAGRAAPGTEVTVLDGDKPVGTVTADNNGEWVLVPEKPLSPGDRQLGVVSRRDDGEVVKSEDVVVLSVPDKPGPGEKPLAVLVPREGMDTKKVFQKPASSDDRPDGALTLDVVDYDERGNIRLSGGAGAGSEVVVYLDNRSIGTAQAAGSGAWELRPEERVAPGLYTLRLDEVREQKVVARLELPFSRAAPLTGFTGEAYVIVQPGNSLWRIARSVLGKGIMYSVIYDANKEQIRDPDLIYPGQVFAVPRTN